MLQELKAEEVKALKESGQAIDYAADLEVTIKHSGKVSLECKCHEFLDGMIITLAPFELIVLDVTAERVVLSLRIVESEEEKIIELTPGEEVQEKFGNAPYTVDCQVKLTAVHAGQILEL